MKAKFKIGDKVVRISGKDLPEMNMWLGGVYTVSNIDSGIYIKFMESDEFDDEWWDSGNFKLYDLPIEKPTTHPHIHADCIKAWAGGDVIEYYDTYQNIWIDSLQPQWNPCVKYRLKPKDLIIDRNVTTMGDGPILMLAYSTPNVRYTFDATTKVLKNVEMI